MFGMQELVVIFGIAFLIFGGKKLPEIGTGLGKAISSFKKGLHEVEEPGKKEGEENAPGAKEIESDKSALKKE